MRIQSLLALLTLATITFAGGLALAEPAVAAESANETPAETAVETASAPEAPVEAAEPPPEPESATDPDPEAAPTLEPAAEAPMAEDPELDLEALGLGGDDELSGPSLSFYGFMDFQYTRVLNDSFFLDFNDFAVGRINLFMDGRISDQWRSLVEVRFLYLPNGTTGFGLNGDTGQVISTLATDYSDAGRALKWGGIEIERAWMEYAPWDYFKLRVGQFISPVGIWYVDHGSPTLVSVRTPFVVSNRLIPERQTGLMAHGQAGVRDWNIRYALSMSNGRGPATEWQDLDRDKAVTASVTASTFSFGEFELGAAVFRGKHTSGQQEFAFVDGNPTLRVVPDNQFDEFSTNLHGKLAWSGLRLWAEFVYSERAFTPEGRPQTAPGVYVKDYTRYGAYVIAGWELPWYGIMPYLQLENYVQTGGGGDNSDASTSGGELDLLAWAVGVTARVLPTVAIKARVYTFEFSTSDFADVVAFESQLAVAF